MNIRPPLMSRYAVTQGTILATASMTHPMAHLPSCGIAPPPGAGFRALLAASLLGLASCVSPLQAPSAFSNERFLCGDDGIADFDTRLASCRQQTPPEQACAGYVSLRAVVDTQSIVVDGPATSAHTVEHPIADGVRTRQIVWEALSPYFKVTLQMTFVLDPSTGELTGLASAPNADILNLEARGGNYLALIDSEIRDFQVGTAAEVRVAFLGQLSRGGTIEACYDVFLTPSP